MYRAACFLAIATLTASADAADKDGPNVQILVFRHHPLLIDTKERMEARDLDEKILLNAAGLLGGFTYGGGLGQGYELCVASGDLRRWRDAVNNLLKAGKLKYYDRWGLNGAGYGLVDVR